MKLRIKPFKTDLKLTEVLARKKFTLSAEVLPPRNGSEQVGVMEQIDALVEAGAEFLAVTKGAGGSLRGGSLPIAQVIKEQFHVPCIAHFTCRDLTPADVENQLMDHHYFGIRNILALRGDPPDGQKVWTPQPGGYQYAYELIEQIHRLNQGAYLQREGGPQVSSQEKTDFCIGTAVYPEHPLEKERIDFFKRKVQAGAQFGISDMLFDVEAYGRFLELCSQNGVEVPILPGTRILRSQAQARRMAAKFRVSVPADVLKMLPEEDAPKGDASAQARSLEKGLEAFHRLVDRLKGYGAPGIHLFVIVDTQGACQALSGMAKLQNP